MKWPFIFYTDMFMGTANGKAIGPIILIRPKYKDDYGLYQHELEHVKQWAIISLVFAGLLYFVNPLLMPLGLGVFGLLYLIPEVRLWSEVAAFKKQAEYYPDDRIPLFAAAISLRYKLKISKENAEKLLRE